MRPDNQVDLRKRFIHQGIAELTLLTFLLIQLAWPLPVFGQDTLRTEQILQNAGLEELEAKLQGEWETAPASAAPPVVATGLEEVIDEPQLEKNNAYARALQALLNGPDVTEESRERLAALKRVGPQIEEHTRRILGSEKIRIAIMPTGSTLKGYAGERSDVEYEIFILDEGGTPLGPMIEGPEKIPILDEMNRLLTQEGYLQLFMNYYSVAMRNASDLVKGRSSAGEDLFRWTFIFLPLAYGDADLIEQARKNLVGWIAQQDSPEQVWDRLRDIYFTLLEIGPEVQTKPHLQSWLSRQGIHVEPMVDLEDFNRGWRRRIGLPDFPEMQHSYLTAGPEEAVEAMHGIGSKESGGFAVEPHPLTMPVETLSTEEFQRRFPGIPISEGARRIYLVPAAAGTTIHFYTQDTLLSSLKGMLSQELADLPDDLRVEILPLPATPDLLKKPGLIAKDWLLDLPYVQALLPIIELALGEQMPSLRSLVLYALRGLGGQIEAVIGDMTLEDEQGQIYHAYFV